MILSTYSIESYICLMFSHWQVFIVTCFCFSRVDDVENLETLRWEDQQNIRTYIQSSGGGSTSTSKSKSKSTAASASKSSAASASKSSASKNVEYGIEVSQTSRAACKHCGQKIIKGEVGF